MDGMTLHQALAHRRTCREFDTGRAVPPEILTRLLWAAQGVTGEGGKRTAPSAHTFYPLRLLVSARRIDGLEAGLYDVAEDLSDLTPLTARDMRPDLQAAALEDQPWVGAAAGIITLCANLAAAGRKFAEQPPMGTRGVRYVHIEAGAAAQNVQLQATAEGLGCVLVAGIDDEATAEVLGLQPPVTPLLHLCFGWPAEG